jgi:hypothetical protein
MSGVPWLGKIRRSQVITTYGIGAIVDLEPGSFVPLGLEEWEKQTRIARKSSFIIYESRLQAQLGVQEFRMAPILEEVQGQPALVKPEYSIPVVRFPRWLECPKCHRLGRENNPFELDADERQLRCTACNQKVNPVRFVSACSRGHLSDFPWVWWAHKNRESGVCENPVIYLRSHGKSAALADLYVQCVNPSCKATKSMGDAFKKSALGGLRCQGKRIWLLDSEPCDRDVRTLQRGASNIQFPAVVSALSIPPVSEPVQQVLDEYWAVYRALPEDALEEVLTGSAGELGIPVQVLISACRRRIALERGEDTEDGSADLRFLEYAALSGSTEDIPAIGGHVAQFQNVVHSPPPEIEKWFDTIGAVSRLREVRAMVGFSRIEPQPVSIRSVRQFLQEGRLAPLSKSNMKWLPAAEIRGEGIFVRFRNEEIESWLAANPELASRATAIDHWSKRVAAERGYEPEYDITPRLLLVHSFAHIMIRRLSIECGYSSAALRERLYIKEADDDGPAMHGVLIYTGTPDSEGSLGGLVRLADPERLGPLVIRALREAQWCGSDPVCLETEPDVAGERIGGAACHCCLLVPETACEKFNKELDRSMLVGHPDGEWKGFFEDVGANGEGASNG